MNKNVGLFFTIYENDAGLRQRCLDAVNNYPGSLECREYVVEDVLLPIADELGYPFTVSDLRAYETKLKFEREVKPDEAMTEAELAAPDDEHDYWLVGHGWSTADDVYKELKT